MAELSTLARPYAKAAFDYANEHGVVNEWEDFLFVASAVVRDKSFQALLDNPAIAAEQKASVLVDLYNEQAAKEESHDSKLKQVVEHALDKLTGSKQKMSSALNNFVVQLSEHDCLTLLPEVYEHYRRHKAQALKQVDAYVTTAYPLTDAQRTLLQSRLAASMNATVVIHESVDPSLLAGATIKIGDKVVDDSMRGKLKQLKTQLTV